MNTETESPLSKGFKEWLHEADGPLHSDILKDNPENKEMIERWLEKAFRSGANFTVRFVCGLTDEEQHG